MTSHPKFILKISSDNQYYFVLTARNGQIIAQSEMYTSKAAAINGMGSVRESAVMASVDDQTQAVSSAAAA